MKYFYKVSNPQAFTPTQANSVFPQQFSFQREGEQLLLVMEASNHITDDQALVLVQRECDRLFFLTGQQLNPVLARIEHPNGTIDATSSLPAFVSGVMPLSPNIERQKWQSSLSVQLRLWQLAQLPNLPVAVQINLLFQIVEIASPDTRDKLAYPPYHDPRKSPDPRTEAKLLRDLSSHGKKKMIGVQVKLYCNHLRIPEESHDPSNADFMASLRRRLPIVKAEARKVIDSAITRTP